jgi:hypothetical protein
MVILLVEMAGPTRLELATSCVTVVTGRFLTECDALLSR